MSGAYTVRAAARGDAAGIASVHVAAWRQAYVGIAPDALLQKLSTSAHEESWDRRLANLDQARCILVASSRKEVIGFISAGPNRDATEGVPGEVYAIYVSPRHQRGGIGKALMSSAVAHLHDLGQVPFLLWALQANHTGRAFYESLGGQLVARGVQSFGEETRPKVAYQWMDGSRFGILH